MTKHDEVTQYRPCVGVMLLNKQGLVWIGRRYDKSNEEGEGYWWQMPQGGIDPGEDVRQPRCASSPRKPASPPPRSSPNPPAGTPMTCRST